MIPPGLFCLGEVGTNLVTALTEQGNARADREAMRKPRFGFWFSKKFGLSFQKESHHERPEHIQHDSVAGRVETLVRSIVSGDNASMQATYASRNLRCALYSRDKRCRTKWMRTLQKSACAALPARRH